MLIKIEIALLISCTIVSTQLQFQQPLTPQKQEMKRQEWTYKDFLKKFKAVHVWEKEFKGKKSNKNLTADEIDKFIRHMDPTEELMSLNVDDVEVTNPMLLKETRREWQPKGRVGKRHRSRDAYQLKPRFYDLMKQIIYQVRDKMVVMQDLRDKYRKDSVYKMGFLFSKIDNECKLFASVAYKAFKYCTKHRQQGVHVRKHLSEVVEAEERVLNHLMEIDLLVDILEDNDRIAVRTLLLAKKNEQIRTWFKEKGVGV